MFEISLLDAIKKGDGEAFNQMFRYYYPRVMAYVAAIVDDEIAEDIVQDVFVYIWENRTKWYAGAGFHSYLFQSAYTRCLDYFKKQHSVEQYNRQKEVLCREAYLELSNEESSVMEELYSKDFYDHLHKLLEQLPVERREVFILAYIEGLRTKEISEKTHIPLRTVESHIYLTIRFLKKRMSKKDFYLLSLLLVSGSAIAENFS